MSERTALLIVEIIEATAIILLAYYLWQLYKQFAPPQSQQPQQGQG